MKKRIGLSLTDVDLESLKVITQAVGATTTAGVCKRCIRLVRFLVDCSEGGSVRVMKDDKVIVVVL
jgi:hypothetical protein